MSKVGVTLASLGALAIAVGLGASIFGAVEADKEHKQIPEIREQVKQDYELHNITLSEYTEKMEELAREDAELPVYKGACIAYSVIAAIGAGVYTWGAIKLKDM